MKTSRSGTVRNFWTPKEDAVLIREANIQLSKGRLQDWNSIATALPGRSNKDCRKRWVKLSTQANKGPWAAEEDKRLCNSIIQYGQRWTMVAEAVGTRSADQCAKRWQNSLNPELDSSEWQSEDEARLVRAVEVHGRNWKLISEAEFPRRSPTDLKNKYVTFERKLKQRSERSATVTSTSTRSSGSYSTPTPSIASLSNMTDRFLENSSCSNSSPYATHNPTPAPAAQSNLSTFPLFDTNFAFSSSQTRASSSPAGATGVASCDSFSPLSNYAYTTPWPPAQSSSYYPTSCFPPSSGISNSALDSTNYPNSSYTLYAPDQMPFDYPLLDPTTSSSPTLHPSNSHSHSISISNSNPSGFSYYQRQSQPDSGQHDIEYTEAVQGEARVGVQGRYHQLDDGRFTLVVENLEEEVANDLLSVMACKGLPGDVDVKVWGCTR